MRLRLYRGLLCMVTALMICLSLPLWWGSSEVARVPWIRRPELGTSFDLALIGTALVALIVAALGGFPRLCLSIANFCLAVLILFDQERFQPWVYQFLLVGIALAWLPPNAALMFARAYVIGLYVHSGLSKLDLSFTSELGPVFLETLGRLVGLHPERWSSDVRNLSILVMPSFELLIGLGLLSRDYRIISLLGSVVLHSILILVLGPFGLGHSSNVLVWNGAILLGNLLLFSTEPAWDWSLFRPRSSWPFGALMVLMSVLPFLEPWGFFDTWPSHGLYASHSERTDFYLHEEDMEQVLPLVREHLLPPLDPPWIRVDLNRLSRTLRGTPLYPQARANHGVAVDLAARHPGPHPVRVVHWGRADRWSGRRSRVELIGIEALRKHSETYWLNAHPSRGRSDAVDPR